MPAKAFIEDYDKIVCFIEGAADVADAELSVFSDGAPVPVAAVLRSPYDRQEIKLSLAGRLDPESPCFVVCRGCVVPAEPLGIYDRPAFNDKYFYDGPLGARVEGGQTVFRLWAPFALAVRLNLYLAGDGAEDNLLGKSMTRTERGVWTAAVAGSLHGVYYTYTVSYNGRADVETADPYAFSCGVNGRRGMVVDFGAPSVTPDGWDGERKAYKKEHALARYTDAVIWETHVRDFSGKTDAAHRNKFLAFTERGLVNHSGESIGLDYLADLGVTHVHLLPVAEYATVDQYKLDDQTYNAFNWGYDPLNYNTPMGAYATDVRDGAVRVRELRAAVAALHARGIGVVFDVVYNHTYNFDAPIARTVPHYFYRFDYRGNPTNGSGCGNETASERPMCRKFIIDSLLAWQDHYHADGFRFDLMGLHDVETMRAVERALHAADPSAIIYGEGWVGGATSLPGEKQCNKWNSGLIKPSAGAAGAVAVFSDVMRDSVKGPVFHAYEGGYVNGRAYENVNLVKFSSMGGTSPNFNTNWVAPSANQVVNYVSAHDNNTLWDKLCLTAAHHTFAERVRMNRMCAAVVLTSRGVPFFQAGEELLRSKPKDGGGFEENSYNAPDSLNNIDWEELKPDSAQKNVRDYYRGLIAFRKAHPALRLCDTDEIENATHFFDVRYDVIAYTLTACGETLFIVYNPLEDVELTLPDGQWSLRVADDKAGDAELGVFSGKIKVPFKSVHCYVKK